MIRTGSSLDWFRLTEMSRYILSQVLITIRKSKDNHDELRDEILKIQRDYKSFSSLVKMENIIQIYSKKLKEIKG